MRQRAVESEAYLATKTLLDRCPAVHVGWLLGPPREGRLGGRWLWSGSSERKVAPSLRSRSHLSLSPRRPPARLLPPLAPAFGVASRRRGRGYAGARLGGQRENRGRGNPFPKRSFPVPVIPAGRDWPGSTAVSRPPGFGQERALQGDGNL